MEENTLERMQAEIDHLRERINKTDKFISQIEADCSPFVDTLLDKVCKRAVRRMNKEFSEVVMCEDMPGNLSFFDKLTILHQERDYEEMSFPPNLLLDEIERVLGEELNGLSGMEKVILKYSECESDSFGFYETVDVRSKLFDRFEAMQNGHYLTAKIQKYIERYGY